MLFGYDRQFILNILQYTQHFRSTQCFSATTDNLFSIFYSSHNIFAPRNAFRLRQTIYSQYFTVHTTFSLHTMLFGCDRQFIFNILQFAQHFRSTQCFSAVTDNLFSIFYSSHNIFAPHNAFRLRQTIYFQYFTVRTTFSLHTMLFDCDRQFIFNKLQRTQHFSFYAMLFHLSPKQKDFLSEVLYL